MADSPENIVNEALRGIGWGRPVADLAYDGSKASRVGLEIYGQTRDELFEDGDWAFARRANVVLQSMKGAVPPGGFSLTTPWAAATYPPPGWLYEYLYPADCIELHLVAPRPGGMMDLLPRYYPFRTDNDQSLNPAVKIVLSNVKDAVALYTARVTNPDLWEPGFRASLIAALSRKFAIALGQNLDLAKLKTAETGAAISEALRHPN